MNQGPFNRKYVQRVALIQNRNKLNITLIKYCNN